MSNLKFVHSGGNSVSLTTPTSNPGSNLTFKLPAADGSAGQILQTDGNGNQTFVNPPLSEVDQWRVTSSFDATDSDVTSNWARNNNDFTLIGSGMTESSGIFTFPANPNGIYLGKKVKQNIEKINNQSLIFPQANIYIFNKLSHTNSQ